MHHGRRRLFTTTALALLLAIVAAGSGQAASGGNSENARLCQNDGWMTLATSDGAAFANPGACVAYAARGGALSPSAALVFELGTCSPAPFGALTCPHATLVGSGLQPGGIVYRCDNNPSPQHPDAFCYPQFDIEADGTLNVSWDETPFSCIPGYAYNYNAPTAAGPLIFTSDTC